MRHLKNGGQFDLEIFGKVLDLDPSAAATIGMYANSGQIGHEQIGQINQHSFATMHFTFDRQGNNHAVVVGYFDRVGLRRSVVGLEANIAADDQHLITSTLEAEDPLLAEIQRRTAQIH